MYVTENKFVIWDELLKFGWLPMKIQDEAPCLRDSHERHEIERERSRRNCKLCAWFWIQTLC